MLLKKLRSSSPKLTTGDRVMVTRTDYTWKAWTPEKDQFIGQAGSIIAIDSQGHYCIKFLDDKVAWFRSKALTQIREFITATEYIKDCKTLASERFYSSKQDKWITEHGIRPGNKILISTSPIISKGWNGEWTPKMNKNLGQVGFIVANHSSQGIEVAVSGDYQSYTYPFEALSPLTECTHQRQHDSIVYKNSSCTTDPNYIVPSKEPQYKEPEKSNIIFTAALLALADHFIFDGTIREEIKRRVGNKD